MGSFRWMRCKWRSVLALSGGERWALAQAWLLLLGVDLALRLMPFRWVQALAERGQSGRATGDPVAMVQRLWRCVDMAARNHLYSMGCLRRALALQALLAQRGIRTELRIGVRKEVATACQAVSTAHAWLEHEGRPIGQPEAMTAQYASLLAPEAAR